MKKDYSVIVNKRIAPFNSKVVKYRFRFRFIAKIVYLYKVALISNSYDDASVVLKSDKSKDYDDPALNVTYVEGGNITWQW